MATVKEVKARISDASIARVVRSGHNRKTVHVTGFVTSTDLKALIMSYAVFLHSGGELCVE